MLTGHNHSQCNTKEPPINPSVQTKPLAIIIVQIIFLGRDKEVFVQQQQARNRQHMSFTNPHCALLGRACGSSADRAGRPKLGCSDMPFPLYGNLTACCSLHLSHTGFPLYSSKKVKPCLAFDIFPWDLSAGVWGWGTLVFFKRCLISGKYPLIIMPLYLFINFLSPWCFPSTEGSGGTELAGGFPSLNPLPAPRKLKAALHHLPSWATYTHSISYSWISSKNDLSIYILLPFPAAQRRRADRAVIAAGAEGFPSNCPVQRRHRGRGRHTRLQSNRAGHRRSSRHPRGARN